MRPPSQTCLLLASSMRWQKHLPHSTPLAIPSCQETASPQHQPRALQQVRIFCTQPVPRQPVNTPTRPSQVTSPMPAPHQALKIPCGNHRDAQRESSRRSRVVLWEALVAAVKIQRPVTFLLKKQSREWCKMQTQLLGCSAMPPLPRAGLKGRGREPFMTPRRGPVHLQQEKTDVQGANSPLPPPHPPRP